MEEYKVIVKDEIMRTDTNRLAKTGFLDAYYEIVKNFTFKELLINFYKYDEFCHNFRESYDFSAHLIKSDDVQLNILKDILYSIKNELGNPDVDLNMLLPLIIYIDHDAAILEFINLDQTLKLKVKTFIMSYLNTMQTKIELPELLPQYDNRVQMIKEHKIALENMNFREMYILIDAIEQDWRTTYNPLVEWLSYVLYEIDESDFLHILDGKSQINDIKTMITKLSNEEKVNVGDKSNELLVKFEIIKTLQYDNVKSTDTSLCPVIAKMVLAFEKDLEVWEKLLIYYFEFPSRCPEFFSALGLIILEISEQALDILVDNLKIEQYSTIESIGVISSCFTSDHLESGQLNNQIERIFRIWEVYLMVYESYMINMLTTDVINIVIHYVLYLMSEEEFRNKLTDCVNSIREIENTWFKNTTEENIFCYKKISLLFVLGYKLDIQEKEELLSDLKRNPILDKKTFQIICE